MARKRRRAKCKVLLVVPLFFAVQAALGVQLERARPEQLDGAFGLRLDLLRRQRAVQGEKPLVLMLGGSRTMTGFRPDLLRDEPYLAFNFGREGSGPVKNLIYLRRLLDAGVRPDLLVLDLTVATMAQHRETPWESRWVDGALFQNAERETVEMYHDLRWRVWGQWLAARLAPSWHGNHALLACLSLKRLSGQQRRDHEHGLDPWGYRPVFPELTPQQREELTRLALSQYGFLPGEDRLWPGARQAVTDLLQLCKAEHIPVMLVVMPEGSQFRALYSTSMQGEFESFLTGLGRETKAPILDARRWIDDEGFFDQHHLSPSGAEQFTRRLAGHINEHFEANAKPPSEL